MRIFHSGMLFSIHSHSLRFLFWKPCYNSFKDFICTSTYADTQVAVKEAFNGWSLFLKKKILIWKSWTLCVSEATWKQWFLIPSLIHERIPIFLSSGEGTTPVSSQDSFNWGRLRLLPNQSVHFSTPLVSESHFWHFGSGHTQGIEKSLCNSLQNEVLLKIFL